jgi:hypothetical protein
MIPTLLKENQNHIVRLKKLMSSNRNMGPLSGTSPARAMFPAIRLDTANARSNEEA